METKQGTLEQSVLDVWQNAAEQTDTKMDGRTKGYRNHRSKLEARKAKREEKKVSTKKETWEIGTDEYRKYLERITPGETIEEKSGDKEAYQKFFNSALKKFKIDSPADLKSDEEKKKFYDYVDKNYSGENDEELTKLAKDFKVSSMREILTKMWTVNEGELPPALKKAIDAKKDKEKKEDNDSDKKKTLTGKKKAEVDVNPDLIAARKY